MAEQSIELRVNGGTWRGTVEPRMLLVHFLREVLGLTGTHIGCDTTSCGACTIVVDGRSVKSCTMFAVQADGREVLTIEGLAKDGRLHPVQEGFRQEHGLQCGFCTPGMIMAAVPFLGDNPDPTDDEVRVALSGNLCRCTGYQNIIRAVHWAAERMRNEGQAEDTAGDLTAAQPAEAGARPAGGA